MNTESSWRPRTEDEARDILDGQYGSGQFDRSVRAGPMYCSMRATGAWYANLGEEYGAYCAAYVAAKSAPSSTEGGPCRG
jgi:hypothetical protein